MSRGNLIRVKSPEFRVSYPSVFRPQTFNPGETPKYSLVMLFPKGTDLSVLINALRQKAHEHWNGNPPAKIIDMINNYFLDGDQAYSKTTGLLKEGYAGHYYRSATSYQKPAVVSPHDPTIHIEEKDDQFYGGCYAWAMLNAYVYDDFGGGIKLGLGNIQKTRDGQRFGGYVPPEQDFTPCTSNLPEFQPAPNQQPGGYQPPPAQSQPGFNAYQQPPQQQYSPPVQQPPFQQQHTPPQAPVDPHAHLPGTSNPWPDNPTPQQPNMFNSSVGQALVNGVQNKMQQAGGQPFFHPGANSYRF